MKKKSDLRLMLLLLFLVSLSAVTFLTKKVNPLNSNCRICSAPIPDAGEDVKITAVDIDSFRDDISLFVGQNEGRVNIPHEGDVK